VTPRRTIATYGARGEKVRVFLERGGELVRVQYYDGPRGAKKLVTKSWTNTTANQRDAKEWARGFVEERRRGPVRVAATLTIRAMWEQYTVAEFPHLRRTTQDNYTEAWREWELFAGRHLVAAQTTLGMLDDFRAVRARRGLSVNRSREIVKLVKQVYRWAERRELLERNRIALYQFKIAKEDRPKPVAEYAPDAFPTLLAQFDPRSSREWRAWAITAIAGTQGARINAILHLRWSDVDFQAATVRWAPEFDKMGHERVQPLTQLATDALYVALGWARARTACTFTTDFVFYSPATKRHEAGDGAYSVGAYWRMLRSAEDAAGVAHVRRRAAHGFRRMAAGNVNALTGNPVEAMQWIGDRDLAMAQRYLKERPERQQAIASGLTQPSAAERKRAPSSTSRKRAAAPERFSPTVTEPQSARETANAPVETDALTTTETTSYDD